MADTFRPTDNKQVLEIVQWAVSEEAPLEIIGNGSKRAMGRPTQTANTLDLSQLTGITLYEPEELVLSAKAGTPLTEIETLLEKHNQELQFEPMDYGPLLGQKPGLGTIGGMMGANLSGPRRLKSGAARDHILGIKAVSGRGEEFKSGGRVVKNVTGYDLSKGLSGSWGTLAVSTDITVKVLPAAETEQTLVIHGLADDVAANAMAIAMGSSAEVSGAAHLPQQVASVFSGLQEAATVLRLEGVAPSVKYRLEQLQQLLKSHSEMSVLKTGASKKHWREIRDVKPFQSDPGLPLWRISTAPTKGVELVAQLQSQGDVSAFYDWQGGLVWVQTQPGITGGDMAHKIRAAMAEDDGHATLIRADASARSIIPVFEPQPPALAALSKRLKESFDPKGILNPGRMVASV